MGLLNVLNKKLFGKNSNNTKIYEIRITKKCNQNCIFCNSTKHIDNFVQKKDEVIKLILELAIEKHMTIVFTGREPTLNNHLIDFIRISKMNKIYRIIIQTNALRCSYDNYVKELKGAGLTGAVVSFHSSNLKIFETITETPGSFNLANQGIKKLLKNNIEVKLNIVINKLNYKSLINICSYINNNFRGINCILFSSLSFSGDASEQAWLFIKYSSIMPYLIRAMDYCLKNQMHFLILDRCGIPFCLLKKFEKYHVSFHMNYNKNNPNTVTSDREKGESCIDCKWDSFCSGYWKKYKELFGDSEFIPVTN